MIEMSVPNHIAIVPDGNRRWARAKGMKYPWDGHKHGIDRFEDLFNWCMELGIEQVSLWVLSTENLKNRSKREVVELLRIMRESMKRWSNEKSSLYKMFEKYEVQVRFFGDLKQLPPELVRLMKRIMKKTEKHHQRVLNILICYGGKFEITRAVKSLVKKAIKSGKVEITEKTIQEHLFVSSNVDLVIRTGGMSRLSNFMLWQAAYGEMYVTDCLWPDFSKRELVKSIKWFNSVKRNFGKNNRSWPRRL